VGSIIFRLKQCNADLMNNQTERLISNTIMLLRNYKNVNRQASSFQLERNLNGKRGRPRFNISSEQLQYLLNYDLTCQQPDIAQALGVSRSTLFRPMRTFGLLLGQRMTDNDVVITSKKHYCVRNQTFSLVFHQVDIALFNTISIQLTI
jgi:hypothetical protein